MLIDAGFGDPMPDSPWQPPRVQRSPGLSAGRAQLGMRPDQITHVIFTHAHGDHIDGATIEWRRA